MLHFSPNKSVYLYCLPKTGSSLFKEYILKKSQLQYIDPLKLYANNKIDTLKIRDFNCAYGPLYTSHGYNSAIIKEMLSEEFTIHNSCIFLVRDPRDIIISQYYSYGWSHAINTNDSENFLKRRKHIQSSTLEEYVTDELQIKTINDRYSLLIKLLTNNEYIKYENIIEDLDNVLVTLSEYNVYQNQSDIDLLHKVSRPTQKENILQHKRSGKVEQYKSKLNDNTISYLSNKFKEVIQKFGYE